MQRSLLRIFLIKTAIWSDIDYFKSKKTFAIDSSKYRKEEFDLLKKKSKKINKNYLNIFKFNENTIEYNLKRSNLLALLTVQLERIKTLEDYPTSMNTMLSVDLPILVNISKEINGQEILTSLISLTLIQKSYSRMVLKKWKSISSKLMEFGLI